MSGNGYTPYEQHCLRECEQRIANLQLRRDVRRARKQIEQTQPGFASGRGSLRIWRRLSETLLSPIVSISHL